MKRAAQILRRTTVAPYLLVSALILWFAFNWYQTFAHLLRYYTAIPASDYWRVVKNIPSYESLNLGVLWQPHNGHRILFPEIVFALDAVFLQCRQLLPFLLNAAFYFALFLSIANCIRSEKSMPLLARAELVLFTGIVIGWPLNTIVLGTPFLLAWTILQVAVVAALADAKHLSVAVLCGVIATFSVANGLALWPVLIGIATLSRWPPRKVAALLSFALVSCILFFWGNHQAAASGGSIAALRHPLLLLGFVASYFSMPFGVIRSPLVGFAFGALSLVLWITCLITAIRRRVLVSNTGILCFGYAAFELLSACMTAAGRMDPNDPGFLAAKAGRYVTVPLVGWALLAAETVWLLRSSGVGRFKLRTIAAAGILILAFMQIRLSRWLRTNDRYIASQQLTALSIQTGLEDPELLRNVFPEPAYVSSLLPILKAQRKSIFASEEVQQLGRRVQSGTENTALYSRDSKPVPGITLQSGSAVAGHSQTTKSRDGRLILLVDRSGTVAGFGRHLPAGAPPGYRFDVPKGGTWWVGFINPEKGSPLVRR